MTLRRSQLLLRTRVQSLITCEFPLNLCLRFALRLAPRFIRPFIHPSSIIPLLIHTLFGFGFYIHFFPATRLYSTSFHHISYKFYFHKRGRREIRRVISPFYVHTIPYRNPILPFRFSFLPIATFPLPPLSHPFTNTPPPPNPASRSSTTPHSFPHSSIRPASPMSAVSSPSLTHLPPCSSPAKTYCHKLNTPE